MLCQGHNSRKSNQLFKKFRETGIIFNKTLMLSYSQRPVNILERSLATVQIRSRSQRGHGAHCSALCCLIPLILQLFLTSILSPANLFSAVNLRSAFSFFFSFVPLTHGSTFSLAFYLCRSSAFIANSSQHFSGLPVFCLDFDSTA